MMISLPSLLNVGALIMLVLFIYSVLGVFLFSGVKKGPNITNFTNFWYFHNALITLFKCATGIYNYYLYKKVKTGSISCLTYL